jgi:hypothetical protein
MFRPQALLLFLRLQLVAAVQQEAALAAALV